MRRRGYRIRQAYHNAIANDVSSNPTIGSHGSNSSSSSSTDRSDENSNIENRPSARTNLFPSPRQSSPEMNRPIVLGLPAVQFYLNPGVGTSEPSIGLSHRSNLSPRSLTDGSGERQNVNANMVNRPGAQAIDFPIPRQSSLEMDHSIVVSNSSTVNEQSSGAIAFLQDFFADDTPLFEEPFLDEEPVFDEEQIQEVNMRLTEEEIIMCIGCETFESIAEETPENKEACSICKEEYVNEEEIGRLDCAHKFHIDCIKQWLVEKNECPVCRRMALMPIDELVDYDDCDIDDDE